MSSGTSTPRGGGRSPQPPSADGGATATTAAGPSPLTIGKRFVKQYYQTLMTTPDQIYRFYQPKSVLSDGEGSSPTDPVLFEAVYSDNNNDKLKERFFSGVTHVDRDMLQIRFEFEHGAIDAQQSVNGGLLLVVSGHVVYYNSATEEEDAAVDDDDLLRKGFVHTFFLNVHTMGTKKSFYVHNDILRFLKNPADVDGSTVSSGVVVSESVAPVVTASDGGATASTAPLLNPIVAALTKVSYFCFFFVLVE